MPQKLAILNTHPIQYFAPLHRRLAQEADLDLTVYFCSHQGAEEYIDVGFGQRLKWDIPLLDGYKHVFLKNLRRRDRVGGFWSLINLGIIKELRRNRYHALLINGHNHATYLIAMAAAKVLGIPVFMRCETHLGLTRSPLKRLVRKPLMSFLYNWLCTACLPIGTRNEEFYLAHGVDPARLFTVPYAVDNAFFEKTDPTTDGRAELRAELGIAPDRPLVLFASKLTRRKRAMDLLVAFHSVRQRGTDAVLAFVGSGDQEATLKEYVRTQEIPDVHFLGFRNQSELPGLYAAADIFVLPADNEPWGLIINEVMCAGLPVIATSEIGAVSDLVKHGENGFTYDAGDIDALTDHLARLLQEPATRASMGKASRRIIAGWDHERCVLGIKQALTQTCSTPNQLVESQAA